LKKLKKILVISGSRAEYYILKNIIEKLSVNFITQVLIHAGHLQNFYGNSHKNIERNKAKIIFSNTNIGKSNSENLIVKSMSKQMLIISKIIKKNKPECILIVGDRTEALAAANVALIYQIPIAHIHGGEVTIGSIDEKIRHAISKISSIHFVTHKKYKHRLIQMGENKKFIKNIGSPSLEILKKKKILSTKDFIRKFNLKPKNFILVSINSENSKIKTKHIIQNTVKILNKNKNFTKVITYPNPDINNSIILETIQKIKKRKDYRVYKYLGDDYSQFLYHCKFIIGNSSSGIIEAPFYKKIFINIGKRQEGRELSKSVFRSNYSQKDINKNILLALKVKKVNCKNNFYKPNTSMNLVKFLKKLNFEKFKYKKFVDL
tara:strand:- start:438 stop:1568 length:1131 start_codon:yes stop_codon:yes gene_type:complete